jgi:hypothetical protein
MRDKGEKNMNIKDLLTKATIEVEYQNKFEDAFFDEEYPMPFFSKELRKENAEAKKYTVETKENGEWFEFLVNSTQNNKIIKRFISTDNVSFKLCPMEGHTEILNFSYKGENLPVLPEENLNLSVSGETMYIENEKYILRDNNSIGYIVLWEKNKFGKKILFDFEYELSFQGDEFLEITKIDDTKNKKDIVEYFEIILKMLDTVSKYIKEENSIEKLESYKRIIPKKISSL